MQTMTIPRPAQTGALPLTSTTPAQFDFTTILNTMLPIMIVMVIMSGMASTVR